MNGKVRIASLKLTRHGKMNLNNDIIFEAFEDGSLTLYHDPLETVAGNRVSFWLSGDEWKMLQVFGDYVASDLKYIRMTENERDLEWQKAELLRKANEVKESE